MRGLSTKPEYLIPYLTLYKNVEVKLSNRIQKNGVARFYSPKQEFEEEFKPYILVYNADSRKIYQECEQFDSETTQCIMRLIRKKFVVPEGEEPLFYILFVLLHEVGHWYDYLNRRDWYNKNFNDDDCEAEEYRNKPCEKSADEFALGNFENAWNELNVGLFHGKMESLEKSI